MVTYWISTYYVLYLVPTIISLFLILLLHDTVTRIHQDHLGNSFHLIIRVLVYGFWAILNEVCCCFDAKWWTLQLSFTKCLIKRICIVWVFCLFKLNRLKNRILRMYAIKRIWSKSNFFRIRFQKVATYPAIKKMPISFLALNLPTCFDVSELVNYI